MVRNCGVRECSIEEKRGILNRFLNERVQDSGNTINIGVVFHICFEGHDPSTVPADVLYTIEMLNKDFNKASTNYDAGQGVYGDELAQQYITYVSLASSCKINFYLADMKFKPLPTQTSDNLDYLDKNIKARSPPVSPEKFLNIWVSDFRSGLLGYAQFPWDEDKTKDGVVIAKGTFGRNPDYQDFNLNKTLTHEVGHWFGLYHTFQETFNYDGGNIDYMDGSDKEEQQETKGDCVVDTPPQRDPTYGNPLIDPTNWPSSKPLDETHSYRHMFMNFMDYSDDAAMFMFTQDQAAKLRQMIHIYRPGIIEAQPDEQEEQEEEPAPEPQPEPQVSISPVISLPHKSRSLVKFLNNKRGSNIQLNTEYMQSMPYSLRTNHNGRIRIEVDVSGLHEAILTLDAKPMNPRTYVWVRPVSSKTWYYYRFEKSEEFGSYSLVLPEPYKTKKSNQYAICIGTSGGSTYSYFDNISVSDVSDSKLNKVTDVKLKKQSRLRHKFSCLF